MGDRLLHYQSSPRLVPRREFSAYGLIAAAAALMVIALLAGTLWDTVPDVLMPLAILCATFCCGVAISGCVLGALTYRRRPMFLMLGVGTTILALIGVAIRIGYFHFFHF